MRLNFRFSLNQLALVLALSALTGLAQAALFDDDEARRAILDLRQRLEQSNKNFTEENAHAGDVDRLGAACLIEDAVDMVDPVAAKRAVWEGNELRLVITPGVDRPGEVDVDGDNAIVWC